MGEESNLGGGNEILVRVQINYLIEVVVFKLLNLTATVKSY